MKIKPMLGFCKSPAIAGLFFGLALISCQTPAPPDQVTLNFWRAMAANDPAKAERYVTKDSVTFLHSSVGQFKDAEFSVGEVVIDGNQARVATVARQTNGVQSTFSTMLVKEEQNWLVDYRATRYNISENIFNGLFDSLKNIGEHLNEQLERQLPLIEREMDSFGRQLKEQLDNLDRELEKSFPPLQPPEEEENPYQDAI